MTNYDDFNTSLTFYDLIGEEHIVWAEWVDNDIKISLFNENDERVFSEVSHRYAWEELVAFSKRVLQENERIEYEKKCGEIDGLSD